MFEIMTKKTYDKVMGIWAIQFMAFMFSTFGAMMIMGFDSIPTLVYMGVGVVVECISYAIVTPEVIIIEEED